MSFNFFRNWVITEWWENCDERLAHKEQPITLKEYIQQNKWYLKRKFKEIKKNEGTSTSTGYPEA